MQLQKFDELLQQIRYFKRIALIGDPGAGKTTTLERVAYELATKALEDDDAPLPLFARLGRYEGGRIDIFLENYFGGLNFQTHLSDKVFLLLDGLNEVSPERIASIQTWIEENKDASLLISCRKLDYINYKLYLQRFDVSPLDVKRIYQFINNYFDDYHSETLFWYLSGKATRESWKWIHIKAPDMTFDDFWFGNNPLPGEDWEQERRNLLFIRKELEGGGRLPGMLGVVCNPFLLFVVIQIYARTGTPPVNQGQLFKQFVALLMEYRGKPASNTTPPWIDEEIQQQALATLAYRMQMRKTGTNVDANWAQNEISTDISSNEAQQILYLAASAGIIEFHK